MSPIGIVEFSKALKMLGELGQAMKEMPDEFRQLMTQEGQGITPNALGAIEQRLAKIESKLDALLERPSIEV